MRHDVTFPLYVEVDEIYNLACPASPIHYQFDPVQTTKTSVHGAINMLGLAKRTRAKIFQASTSEVYGDPSQHPQTEDYWGNVNPIGPRSCYDEGKRCAETLFFDYHRQHRLRIKVVRIFNTYGPADAPERRAGGVELHRPGAEGRADHPLRRRQPDPELLLRRRPDRGVPEDDGEPGRGDRADQPRQSRGVHHPRARREGHGADRLAVGDRAPAAAGERPDAAPARHRPGEGDARLGADGAARGGAEADHRLFRPAAGRGGGWARLYPSRGRRRQYSTWRPPGVPDAGPAVGAKHRCDRCRRGFRGVQMGRGAVPGRRTDGACLPARRPAGARRAAAACRSGDMGGAGMAVEGRAAQRHAEAGLPALLRACAALPARGPDGGTALRYRTPADAPERRAMRARLPGPACPT